jgi:hypothetical protein
MLPPESGDNYLDTHRPLAFVTIYPLPRCRQQYGGQHE